VRENATVFERARLDGAILRFGQVVVERGWLTEVRTSA